MFHYTTYLLLAFFLVPTKVTAQPCAGSWALQRPLTSQCVTGQWVGWQNNADPLNCPTNPDYVGVQSNTFTFDIPVSNFNIDFKGFEGSPYCARIEIKVNGLFYQLTNDNLNDFPSGSTCTSGSFANVIVTDDGYITTSGIGGPGIAGWGRININYLNITSVTVSTNDGAGTVFSNPFNCSDVIPLTLEQFSGSANNCIALLNWKSGLEVNVRNIEVQQSFDQLSYTTVAEENAKGSNSHYSIELTQTTDAFYRLKINDFDGSYQFSEVIHVRKQCNNTGYQIYPNPAEKLIFISNLKTRDQVKVFDLQGRQIIHKEMNQLNHLDISSLSSGIYIVQVIHEGKIVESLKLLKR